jgi:hypothetical protein
MQHEYECPGEQDNLPMIQGFPNLIPGLIEMYETKLSIFELLMK